MANPYQEVLSTAILQELWEMKAKVIGPLRPFDHVQDIPIFSSNTQTLFTSGDDSLVSPTQYFVCEKKHKAKLQAKRVEGRPGTFLRCAWGPIVLLEASIAEINGGQVYEILPLTDGKRKDVKFNPVRKSWADPNLRIATVR